MLLSGGETFNVTISSIGTLSGVSSGGCQSIGTIKPRASGTRTSSTSHGPPAALRALTRVITTSGIAIWADDEGNRRFTRARPSARMLPHEPAA